MSSREDLIRAARPAPSAAESAFAALQNEIKRLEGIAPQDHDVLIEAFNLAVREVRWIEGNLFLFHGLDQFGHEAAVVCHVGQLVARVVYRPRADESRPRLITGFWHEPGA